LGGGQVSDKSVAQKLLIKKNYKVLILREPVNYSSILGELPSNITILKKSTGLFDLVQIFVTSKKELEAHLEGLKAVLKLTCPHLWVNHNVSFFREKTTVSTSLWK
jgi:hypothetical protein